MDLGPEAPATAFCDRWNGIAREGWDDISDYMHEQLVEALQVALSSHLLKVAVDTGDTNSAAQIACDFLATGTLGVIPPGISQMFTNVADGVVLDIEMTNWQPRLTFVTDKGRRRAPHAMPDGIVFHQVVTFPTGELLVADSVRLGGIPDQTNNWTNRSGLSLNYAFHRIVRTSQLAAEMGIVDVGVGSDGPGLLRDRKSGNLFAGWINPDKDDFEEVANICHDYWGTTIIDRERIYAALIKAGSSAAEANFEIEDWISASPFHSQVTVPAGIWNLYWDDDRKYLAALLDENGIDAPAQTRFALTQAALPLPDAAVRSLANTNPDSK